MYGSVNFNLVDTEPGAPTAFAPPIGFDGDYVTYMLERIRSDPGVKQHVACVARRFRFGDTPTQFKGCYSALAEKLAMAVCRKMERNKVKATPDA